MGTTTLQRPIGGIALPAAMGHIRKDRPTYVGLVRSLEATGMRGPGRQWYLRLGFVDLVVLPMVCALSSAALRALGFVTLVIVVYITQIGQTALKTVFARRVVEAGGVVDACSEVLGDDEIERAIRRRRRLGLAIAVLTIVGFGTVGRSRWGTLDDRERCIAVAGAASLAGYQYANIALWGGVFGVVSAGLVARVDAVRRDFEECFKKPTRELYASYERAHRECLRASEDFAAFFVVAEFVLVLLFILGIFATIQQAHVGILDSRTVFAAASTCVVFGLGVQVFCNVVAVTTAGERVLEAANRLVVRVATGGRCDVETGDVAPIMHLRQHVEACPLCFAPCGFKVEVKAGISFLYFLLSIATTVVVYVLGFTPEM